VSHAYEALLSGLQLIGGTRRLKSVLVTSALPGEGKTTVSINLALTLMQGGARALIIDADLRKPALHQVLDLENARGLADIVTDVLDLKDLGAVVQTVESDERDSLSRRSLSVITSGKASLPAFAGLGSPRVRQALERLVASYDLVLVDSPPLLAFNDALLLAPIVDAALLVLATGVVREDEAQRAKKLLADAGAPFTGIVMNGFDEKLHGSRLHAYGGSYSR
jgi:capsular exopolysaccharide synthesis family protein